MAGKMFCVAIAVLCGIALPETWAAEGTDPGTFDAAAFREPPAVFWPGPFWVWNDKLDAPKMAEQLRDMVAHGSRSVCMLPMPAEFRPTTMGTQLDPPYLTEPYFQQTRAAAAESARLGMHFWLYDEGGWPSGSACGRVTQRNPRAGVKYLRAEDVAAEPGKTYTVPENAVCAAAWEQDAWHVYRGGQTIDVPQAGARLRLFQVVQGGYVDAMSADAIRTFLELTHEQYKKYLGEYFGKTIRYTFTDEPGAASVNLPKQMAWTDDFAEVFAAHKGYDLLPWLPKLLNSEPASSPEDQRAKTRVLLDYYDVRATLFRERYLETIRQWCAANGLQSSGHLNGEDEPVGNATYGFGHILRAMRGLDLPGTDVIWRQLFPGGRTHPFAKYASSVARQKGQPLVVCEAFCVYGDGLTPAEMRWVTDHQYVRGTTLTVAGCYPLSTREHLMPGERPHFCPTNPLWRYMDLFNAYTARLGYLLTRGQPVSTTAVYLDVRSIWAGGEDRQRAIRLHEELAEALLSRQREFDFIDDDVLAGREGRVEAGTLAVGPMRYDTVLVPVTAWMEPAALTGLADFARQGGTVIAVEGLPQCDGGERSLLDAAGGAQNPDASEIRVGQGRIVVANLEKAAALPAPLIRTASACPEIRVCKRTWEDKALYFLTNQAGHSVSITAQFPETAPAVVCDLEEACQRPLATRSEPSGSTVELVFEPWGSQAILFRGQPDAPPRQASGRELLVLNDGWTLRPLRQYRIGEEDYEVKETSEAKATPVALGDWRDALGPGFSGDAEYTVRFTCDPQQAGQKTRLELGRLCYACEVRLNGQSLGQRIWAPFAVDLTGKLRTGENELVVVVTNTLANAILDPPARERFARLKTGLCYDGRAAEFEKDSLPSGLFGPVRVVVLERE